MHVIATLDSRLGKPGYWEAMPQDYHWHIELVPRLSQSAGFEWGSGFYINPLSREDAAHFLRGTDPNLSL